MKLIDVNTVLDPNYHAKSLEEALAAYVVVAQYKEKLGAAEDSLFGDVLGQAQITYGRFKEAAGPDSAGTWYVLAADQFKEEFSAALASGKAFGCSEKQMKNFGNYCQLIWKAMFNGCPILERDKAGNYVYGSRGKIQSWNTKFDEREKERKAKEAMDAAIAANPKLAALRGGKADAQTMHAPGDNPNGLDALLATVSPELAHNLREYVEGWVGISQTNGTTKFKDQDETFEQKAIRVTAQDVAKLGSIFASDMANIRRAATAA